MFILQEMIDKEEAYIDTLKQGIENYVTIFNDEIISDVTDIQSMIFGTITCIKDFHELIFFPCLQDCGSDIKLLCEKISKFISVYIFKYSNVKKTNIKLILFISGGLVLSICMVCN